MAKRKIKPKERKLVAEYIKDMHANKAAERAKLPRSTAMRILAKPQVKAEINQKLDEIQERSIVDVEYVLKNLKEVVERCMQRAPVMAYDREEKGMVQVTDEDGRDVWQFDSAGVNRALENIGKYLKMFTDRQEVTGKDGGPIQINIVSWADAPIQINSENSNVT